MHWSIRDARGDELDALVTVWRRAVDATHDFLGAEDVTYYERMLRRDLPRVVARVAVDEDDTPRGFLVARRGFVDMLFVDPDVHGRGAGTALLDDVARQNPILTVDVNEQNPRARGWYARRGFVETGRSELDGDGRPFPVLHLRRST